VHKPYVRPRDHRTHKSTNYRKYHHSVSYITFNTSISFKQHKRKIKDNSRTWYLQHKDNQLVDSNLEIFWVVLIPTVIWYPSEIFIQKQKNEQTWVHFVLHKYNMRIHEAQKGRHGLLHLAFKLVNILSLVNIKLCLSSQINPHDHILEINRVIEQHYNIIILMN
jgi:hypothetical protein